MAIPCNLIAVIGPTASGKTAFAARLAWQLNGEVISADSRQIYRRMDLGTGKDYADYRIHDTDIPVHLTDIAEPGYKYSVFEYQRDFIRAFLSITGRNRWPILCGGSGMYIEAATRGYRLTEVPANDKLRMEFGQKTLQELQDILASMKKMHNISDLESPARALRAIEIETYYLENPAVQEERPPIRPVFIGVRFERAAERERITRRLYDRLASGMVEEVRQLLNSGISPADMMYYGLEYKFITRYLCGELAYDTMVSLLNTAIHQYAKRQRTWFRKMEKEGITIHWIDGELPVEKKTEIVLQLLETP